MKILKIHTLLIFCFIFLLSACAANNTDSLADKKAKVAINGSLLGAAAGMSVVQGAMGPRIAAAYVGGAFVGTKAPEVLDDILTKLDKQLRKRTLFSALKEGVISKPSEWKNDNTNHKGIITPLNQFNNENGHVCREFSEVTIVDEQRIEQQKTACLNPTGYWTIE